MIWHWDVLAVECDPLTLFLMSHQDCWGQRAALAAGHADEP
jgi:hypothetical protein